MMIANPFWNCTTLHLQWFGGGGTYARTSYNLHKPFKAGACHKILYHQSLAILSLLNQFAASLVSKSSPPAYMVHGELTAHYRDWLIKAQEL